MVLEIREDKIYQVNESSHVIKREDLIEEIARIEREIILLQNELAEEQEKLSQFTTLETTLNKVTSK